MFEIIAMILVLAGVCVLAFYATKLIAGSYQHKSSGNNIVLRDRVMLSADKYLLVVSVADKTLFLSVTKDKVEVLSELDAEKLTEPPKPPTGLDFSSVFKNTALSKFGLKKEDKSE